MDRNVEILDDDIDVLGGYLDLLVVDLLEVLGQVGTDPALQQQKAHFSLDHLPSKQDEVVPHNSFAVGQSLKRGDAAREGQFLAVTVGQLLRFVAGLEHEDLVVGLAGGLQVGHLGDESV